MYLLIELHYRSLIISYQITLTQFYPDPVDPTQYHRWYVCGHQLFMTQWVSRALFPLPEAGIDFSSPCPCVRLLSSERISGQPAQNSCSHRMMSKRNSPFQTFSFLCWLSLADCLNLWNFLLLIYKMGIIP